jgi:hypothetical protein
MPQLTSGEIRRLDRMIRHDKIKPIAAWRELKQARERAARKAPKGQKLKAKKLSSTTVYDYIRGHTHARGSVESRGRKAVLGKSDVQRLMQARRR